MARLRTLAEYIAKLAEYLDQEVSRGFDLSDFSQLLKFLHALQMQAQALIDMAQRAAALLGEPTNSYVLAGVVLARRGVFSQEDLKFYRAVVGFRNVVVHGYLEVDVGRVAGILARREYRRLVDLAMKILGAVGDP